MADADPQLLMTFPCFVITPQPRPLDARIREEKLSSRTDVIVLYDRGGARVLLPTFTESDFALRFMLTTRGMPSSSRAVRVESPADLALLLQALAHRMGLMVDLLVDASETFPGWQIAYRVATAVMANVQ